MKLDVDLKRVFILGADGLLGAALQKVFTPEEIQLITPLEEECDIRDLSSLRSRLGEEAPDLVINCAAQTDVDGAESRQDLSFAINATGAQNVALAAAEQGIPLAHISTDYVFDGELGEPYREYHPTGEPPNVYGRSKLQGELLVRHTWPRHFILRVAALYGAGRKTFVDWILDNANPAAPLTIVEDRFASPTWTDDLARQILALVRTPFYGTYHATGHGVTSWYGFAREALTLMRMDPAGVVPIPDAQLKSAARRGPNTALDNHLLRQRGMDTMLPWRDALAAYLEARA